MNNRQDQQSENHDYKHRQEKQLLFNIKKYVQKKNVARVIKYANYCCIQGKEGWKNLFSIEIWNTWE